jgi:superfamily II DNA or RNA helicase
LDNFATILNDIRNQADPGKVFEKLFSKWFLENDPYWKTQVKQVWLWDDWPDRWGRDKGIDLIFKHKNGETWAVQAKCYEEKYSITKTDIDKFLSESNRPQIHKRLLMSTTNRLGSNAIEVMDGQEKMVVRYLLDDFRNSGLKYPSTLSQLNKPPEKVQLEIRPYQQKAIAAVVNGLKSDDRGQLIMACGTGKTLVTLWVKEQLESKTTLVLLPSLNLLAQTLQGWTKNANTSFEVLNVCSDTTVGKRERSEDLEVTQAPFDVTSDVSVISAFLQLQEPKVIFCTYQSSELITEAQCSHIFDLIVCDEAHRCTGLAKSTFTRVLDNQLIKANKRLFTTATPRIFSNKVSKAAEETGNEIYGMDDEQAFGPVFHRYTFGQAIADEALTDYQVVVVGVDEPMVKQYIQNRKFLSTSSGLIVNAEDLATKIALLKATADYDLKRIISFHSRVKSAQQFAASYEDALEEIDPLKRPSGRVRAEHVDGEMTTEARRAKLIRLDELYDAERRLLANARCLAEGVDVPALDGIAFIDPKESQTEIIQAVGRAIRKSAAKAKGTIVLPVFLQPGEDPEEIINNSKFKPIWNVIKALRAHDEKLAEELDRFRFDLGRKLDFVGSTTLEKVFLDLPSCVDRKFASAIITKLVRQTTSSWEQMYGELYNYFKVHGHTRVPDQHKQGKKTSPLASWVMVQRRNKENLTEEQIRRLDAIDFVRDPRAVDFEERILELETFLAEHGHAKVPKRGVKGKYADLGNWVTDIRRRINLTGEQIERLNKLNFVWDPQSADFEENFLELEAFFAENGHTRVLLLDDAGNRTRLGSWVSGLRRRVNLTEEQIKRLDKLGFIWDLEKFDWEEKISELEAYFVKHGHIEVSQRKKETRSLSTWMSRQRKKKAELSVEQIRRLDALGFVWDTYETKWEEKISELEAFFAEHGHIRIPAKDSITGTNNHLGNYIQYLRRRKKSLTEEQIRRLDALGFDWDPFTTAWENFFTELEAFFNEHGHTKVPMRSDTKQLYTWTNNQRQKRRKNKLTEEQITRLDQLGFVWIPSED